MTCARPTAFQAIYRVVRKKQSLATFFDVMLTRINSIDRALCHALVYGVLREYQSLSFVRDSLLDKPQTLDDSVAIILNLGIFQLLRLSLGDHGVINDTVQLAAVVKHSKAKGLINAILRRVQRERSSCLALLNTHKASNIPSWLKRYYRQNQETLALLNTTPPPITLRLRTDIDRAQWLVDHTDIFTINPLHPQAVTLKSRLNISELLGFSSGLLSVQDAGAQWAATLLAPQNGETILDACAAPGGKTGHIIELAPRAKLIALDSDASRLSRVAETLTRLNAKARYIHADATMLENWWDKTPFDAILLDAPCSGSGVLRRHPDIAFLRTAADLAAFEQTQYRLLCRVWETLKSGGRLLYTTCSLLPQENQQLIERFLSLHPNACLHSINVPESTKTDFGTIHFPSQNGDGFFYALLGKII